MNERFVVETHHGRAVWVNTLTEPIRRTECLCLNCKNLHDKCAIAVEGYRLATLTDIAFMVTRCPKFIAD